MWLSKVARRGEISNAISKNFVGYCVGCEDLWCEYFQPDHEVPGDEEHNSDEGPDEMFRFIKVMK